jgi:hypothetical protein
MHSIGAVTFPVDASGIWFMSTASPHPFFSGAESVKPPYFTKTYMY